MPSLPPIPKRFCQYYQKTPWKQKLNFSRSALFHTKVRVFLKYFVRGFSQTLWKLKRIGDILIMLRDAISEFWFRSGKLESDWNKLLPIITRCTWWKFVRWAHICYQMRRSTQKEFCSPTHFLLLKIKSNFIT